MKTGYVRGLLVQFLIEAAMRLLRRRKDRVESELSAIKSEWFTVDLVTFYFPAPPEVARAAGLNPDVEGGPLDRFGNAIWGETTLEDFQRGGAEYVTVAVDPERRDLMKRYLESPSFPGVRFRIMDVGGFGRGRGLNWLDIASSDPDKAKSGTMANVLFRFVGDE